MRRAETCGGEFKRPWFLHFSAADQERLRKKVLEYLDRENVFGDHFSEFETLQIGDLLSVPWRGLGPEWRAFYNATWPHLWGIETTDPAAVKAGLEIVIAPCMPEHAAEEVAAAFNQQTAIRGDDW